MYIDKQETYLMLLRRNGAVSTNEARSESLRVSRDPSEAARKLLTIFYINYTSDLA